MERTIVEVAMLIAPTDKPEYRFNDFNLWFQFQGWLSHLTYVHHPPLGCKGKHNILCHAWKGGDCPNGGVSQLEHNTEEGNEGDVGQCAHNYGGGGVCCEFILCPPKLEAGVEVVDGARHWKYVCHKFPLYINASIMFNHATLKKLFTALSTMHNTLINEPKAK